MALFGGILAYNEPEEYRLLGIFLLAFAILISLPTTFGGFVLGALLLLLSAAAFHRHGLVPAMARFPLPPTPPYYLVPLHPGAGPFLTPLPAPPPMPPPPPVTEPPSAKPAPASGSSAPTPGP
jgi:hypothetical protein